MLDLSKLSVGDDIHHPLLVLDVQQKGGDHPRTVLVLGNRTGRIESAPFWAGRDETVRDITKGMLAQIVGKVSEYRGSLQLEATSVRALPRGSVELSELVPTVGAVDKYWKYLDDTRLAIDAPRLRAVLDLFYADDAFRVRYEQCPGAPGTGHHALLGGLLQHTCEVVLIARQIAKVARADEDLVAAGAMLHDIGKLESYTWEEGVFDTTEHGRLAGHVAIGATMLATALAAQAQPVCTPSEAMLLEHFILSHHGKLEWGAAVKPMTLEAEILHFADDASAKTAAINDAYNSAELFPGDSRLSSKRVWQLDRWLLRGNPDFGRAETAMGGGGKDEAVDQAG